MTTTQAGLAPKMKAAIVDLKATIRQHHPGVVFRIAANPDDPEIVELVAIVDLEDPDQVLDVVIDRQMQIQIHDELPIFVVTERSGERVAAMVKAENATARTSIAC